MRMRAIARSRGCAAARRAAQEAAARALNIARHQTPHNLALPGLSRRCIAWAALSAGSRGITVIYRVRETQQGAVKSTISVSVMARAGGSGGRRARNTLAAAHLYQPASVLRAASAAAQQAACQARMRRQRRSSVQGPSRRSTRFTTFMFGVACSSPVCGSNLRRPRGAGAGTARRRGGGSARAPGSALCRQGRAAAVAGCAPGARALWQPQCAPRTARTAAGGGAGRARS